MTNEDPEYIKKLMSQQGYVQDESGYWVKPPPKPVAAQCRVCYTKPSRRNGRCEDCTKLSDD